MLWHSPAGVEVCHPGALPAPEAAGAGLAAGLGRGVAHPREERGADGALAAHVGNALATKRPSQQQVIR